MQQVIPSKKYALAHPSFEEKNLSVKSPRDVIFVLALLTITKFTQLNNFALKVPP